MFYVKFIMDNLFSHPGFRLIFIDDDGMSLISPLEHIEGIIENGYRCISHLWGNATKWNDHPIKNIPWGVDVREEKRAKLLQIFNHYKGYFWMDVFCTDQESSNKPLSIMGDVYRNCKECVCMLDIKIPKHLRQPPEMWHKIRIMAKHTMEIVACKWSERVWTLQEWVFPPKILYTEETSEKYFCIIDRDDIMNTGGGNAISAFLWIIAYTIVERKSVILASTAFLDRDFSRTVEHLIKSGRKCKDPRDYYYGVAGIFGISLTDGLTFDEL